MATVIYWFSGSGNSFFTARSIAAGLEDTSELRSIAAEVKHKPSLASDTRVGIIFPVHGFGPPLLVQRLIRKLPVNEISSVFAVATYAASPGITTNVLQKQLARSGLTLKAMYGIKMPEIYTPMGGPPKPGKQELILTRAEQKIQTVITDLNREAPSSMERANFIMRLIGMITNPLFRKNAPKADKNFYPDEKCNHCEICARICPVENIELRSGVPTWLNHCEQCFGCLHWCPESAIQYGKRSRKQPRYHHPAVNLEALIPPGT